MSERIYVPALDWGYYNQPIKLSVVKVNHMCDFIPSSTETGFLVLALI